MVLHNEEPVEEIIVIGRVITPGDPGELAATIKFWAGMEASAAGMWKAIQQAIVSVIALRGQAIPHGQIAASAALYWMALFAASEKFWKSVEADPPQRDYKRVVRVPSVRTPQIPELPESLVFMRMPAFNHLGHMISCASGVLDALERALGAWEDKNEHWTTIHLANLSGLMTEYSSHKQGLKNFYKMAGEKKQGVSKKLEITQKSIQDSYDLLSNPDLISDVQGKFSDYGGLPLGLSVESCIAPVREMQPFVGRKIHDLFEEASNL